MSAGSPGRRHGRVPHGILLGAPDLADALEWIAETLPYLEVWHDGMRSMVDPKIPESVIGFRIIGTKIDEAKALLKRHGYAEITGRGVRAVT